jgi:hypothetical protein
MRATLQSLVSIVTGPRDKGPSETNVFAPVLRVWKPEHRPPVVLLRWVMTEWCNYTCPYCPQTHERRAPKGSGMTAHAFDNFPAERWLEAFDRHFADKRLSMVITGGEPFVDRKAMPVLLAYLTGLDGLECLRIDTNAWWNPDDYSGLDKSRIILMCTFHPSQTTADRFFSRIDALLRAGFQIGMVNYVMSAENAGKYAEYRQELWARGIPLHPNPLWGEAGQYSPSDVELLRAELPEPDFLYRTAMQSPGGKMCLYPSLAYEMNYKGDIHVGCHGAARGSFFDDRLPELFAGPVPCPDTSCVCLDKYSFLGEISRNTDLNPLRVYGELLRTRSSEAQGFQCGTGDSARPTGLR